MRLNPTSHLPEGSQMLESWRRSHHILPPMAFEKRFASTVLLPMRTESVRRDVSNLRKIIEGDFLLPADGLLRHAGLHHRRALILLRMREGLDWESFVGVSNGARFYSAVSDELAGGCVPSEVRVEYLVAELERHGFEFRVSEPAGTMLHMKSKPDILPRQELSVWINGYYWMIARYIKSRDGIGPVPVAQEKFIFESPKGSKKE